MSEAAEDQGHVYTPYDWKAELAKTREKVDRAREARLSRTKDEWVSGEKRSGCD